MVRDPKDRATLIEMLIAGGLAAISFATGQEPWKALATAAAGVGGNWVASLAEQSFQRWRNGLFTDHGALNQDITWALNRAFQNAVRQLEQVWKRHRHYQYLIRTDPEGAERSLASLGGMRRDTDALFRQSARLIEVLQSGDIVALLQQNEVASRRFLTDTVRDYLYGHDDELVTFVEERLAGEWVVRFYDILKGQGKQETRAWRAFQQLCWTSLSEALGEIRQDTAEARSALQWLQKWAKQLKGEPETPHGWSEHEDLVADLLEQVARATLPRPKVYVSTVWEPLRLYQEAVVRYLTSVNYEVVSDERASRLPIEQQLRFIRDCDLFVGIYAHKKGALPNPPRSRQVPAPVDEFEEARKWFRRCLVFVASFPFGVSDLTLRPPVEPMLESPPRRKIAEFPAPPPKVPKGLGTWFKTKWAEAQGQLTPEQEYRYELHKHERECRRIEREQSKLDRVYNMQKARYKAEVSEKRARFRQQKQQYDSRIAMQESFLADVDDHFSVRRFTSADDLVSALQLDFDALERAEISGFSERDVLARWREWAVNHRQAIREQLPYAPSHRFDSPVQSILGEFLSYAWHEQIEELASKATAAAQAIVTPELKAADTVVFDKITPYCQLPLNCKKENYVTISRQMEDWCERASIAADEARDRVGSSEQEESLALRYPVSLDALLGEWKEELNRLGRFLASSIYGKCLLVMGGAGSGKTHLVSCLLRSHGKSDADHALYCLYVSTRAVIMVDEDLPAVNQLLMDSAHLTHSDKVSGPEWRSLEEFANFVLSLDNGKGKLLIIFDDLDLWIRDHGLNLAELEQFIEQHTKLHNVHWVFCLSEANYDLMSDPNHERFWRKYGFVGWDYVPAPCGWISLDYLNKISKQWQRIVEYQLELCDKEVPADLAKTLDESARELLHNPFIAWVLAQLLCEGKIPLQELINLNYISFAQEFWHKRLDQLIFETVPESENAQSWRRQYWRAIHLVTSLVMESRNLTIGESLLTRDLINANREEVIGFEQVVAILVEKLKHAGLLRGIYEPRLVGKYGNQLRLGFLPLWQWQAGDYLVDRLPADVDVPDRARDWLEQYFAQDWEHDYLAGVVEFFILLVDLGENVDRRLALAFTLEILRVLPSFQPEVWLAASKASAEYQFELASWLDHNRPEELVRAEGLHRYLYFVRYAEPSGVPKRGLTFRLRLKLLQPYYGAIRKGEYFRSFLESLVRNEQDGNQVARAFVYLHGIEDHLNEDTCWTDARQLADWTYDRLMRFAEPAEAEPYVRALHPLILQFLDEMATLNPPKEYDKHWVFLTRRYCDDLAEYASLDLLGWLEDNEWFSWSTSSRRFVGSIRLTMEEQLTTAFGVRFREKTIKRPRQDYLHAVEEWSDGSSEQKSVVVFLIYHTVPSEGEYSDLPADSRLWKVFQKLRSDPDKNVQRLMRISKIREWYERQVEAQERRRQVIS